MASKERGHRTQRVLACATGLALVGVVLAQVPSATAAPIDGTGFAQPYAGTTKYLPLAPVEASSARQVNKPLGRERADQLAENLGFDTSKVLSKKQYAAFISGKGKGGGTYKARQAAKLVELSVRYLTNTTATKMYRTIDGKKTRILLGSYGLIVNEDGLLESPANPTSPVRQVNWVLAPAPICEFPEAKPPPGIPCGYMVKWFRNNDARETLRALYASAYPGEVVYGNKSQGQTEYTQLVPNTNGGKTRYVGMAMAPSIWIVNFLLIYALNPRAAANMPAYWAALPPEVAEAITDSPTGQVPYSTVDWYFPT